MSQLALQRIAEAKRSRATRLDLGRCGLTHWPEELWELTWLEELNLRNRVWDEEGEQWIPFIGNQGPYNCLLYIPNDIERLVSLRKLELGGSGRILNETHTSILAIDSWYLTDLSPLGKCTNLQSLKLWDTEVKDLSALSYCQNLQNIDLTGTKIPDLAVLSGCQNLLNLTLYQTQINNLKALSDCVNLQYLNLRSTNIDDLSALENCKQIKNLDLRDTQIVDLSSLKAFAKLQVLNLQNTLVEDLEPLSECQKLQSINLWNTNVTQIDALANCGELQTLDLAETKVKDLNPLEDNSNLKSLDLASTKISDLGALRKCKNLEVLNLYRTQVRDLVPLENCKNLQNLNLTGTKIQDLNALKACSNLQELNLWGTSVKDLSPLGECISLRNLNLRATKAKSIDALKSCKNLEVLNLWDTKIHDLSALSNCKSLQELNVWSTPIHDLSPLMDCNQLRNLNLRATKIKEISALRSCSNLQILNLRATKVLDISALCECKNLQTLILYQTPIKEIKALKGCHKLENLDLYRTPISDLTPLIGSKYLQNLNLYKTKISNINALRECKKLQNLDLTGTDIDDLKPLSECENLLSLNLSETKVHDLNPVKGFLNLQTLDLRKTQVNDISTLVPLIERGIPVVWNDSYRSSKINVYECPLSIPPPETVREGNRAVLQYFEDASEQGLNCLYEAKLVIVGEARVGKTTLRRKLEKADADMPSEGDTTHGIDICSIDFDMPSGQKFVMHTWDFGGQDIYQATHQFFFTRRSLYVLVDDASREDTRLKHWLRKVDVLSDKSPIIVVQNHKSDRIKAIDWKGLVGNFLQSIRTPLHGFNFSLPATEDWSALQVLKEKVQHEIQQLELVGIALPKQWIEIRKAVLELEYDRPYISQHEYLELCENNEILHDEKALNLSEHLHCLGVFLHFQHDSILRHYVILQKEWATNAVYKIFDSPLVVRKLGRFQRKDLVQIWHEDFYKRMHDELIRLMENFELCFRIPDVPEEAYIIPQLLPKSQPDYDFSISNALCFEFVYTSFMPDGVLSRLIVRLHRYVHDLELAWQHGVILSHNGTKAEVIESFRNNKITLSILGSEAQYLLGAIVDHMDAIHASYGTEMKNSVRKRIPCNCSACQELLADDQIPHFYELASLVRRKERGKRTVECDISYEDVSVQNLLDAVFLPEDGREDVPPKQKLLTWLAAGKQKKVLEAIAPHCHEAILFQGALAQLDKQELLGTITREVLSVEQTNLSNRIIKTLDTLSWLR